MNNQEKPIAARKRRTKTRAYSTEPNLPTLTTEEAAALLAISAPRLRLEAKQNGGWCKRGKWLILRNSEKQNCWYPHKEQMPRPQKLAAKAA
jgi:hypothetical protein